MKERRDIFALHQRSPRGVLVSLVRANGSSYRRPGAHLYLAPTGETAGTISGGCLEADLLKKARWKVSNGPTIESYNTAFDDTAEIPYGLGCGGEVDLLLEDTTTPEAAALLEAMAASIQGEQRLVATVLPPLLPSPAQAAFARIILDTRGDVLFATESLPTEDIVDLRTHLRRALADPAMNHASTGDIFCERLAPLQRLIIFGAGEDAKPLAAMAAQLGWTVIVADSRSQHARPERFPTAQEVLVVTHAHEANVTTDDVVVLMTHSFEQDRRILTGLLTIEPRYLGILGARHRSALLLSEAAHSAGIAFETACDLVHAPVGLNLGGDGPEAIALAILSEAQSIINNHTLAPRAMNATEARKQLLHHQESSATRGTQPYCALDEVPIAGTTEQRLKHETLNAAVESSLGQGVATVLTLKDLAERDTE